MKGRIVDASVVDRATREAMFDLLTRHFTGVDREMFEFDLREKNVAILLEDEDGRLHGFSTLLVYQTTAGDRSLTIVYSGDTIVERGSWGNPTLPRSWMDAVTQLVPEDAGDVYWLLITSGFRTYRFLPVFFKSFYPRFDEPTPARTQALVDAIADRQFGGRYDRNAGVVRFARPQVLAEDLLKVADGRLLDPHVRYFVERNPGFVAGDELVCLTRIHDDNLTTAGRRLAYSRKEAAACL